MIENFSVVREGQVYRGAQYENWQDLEEIGVNTVLKLNTYGEGIDTGSFDVIYLPISLASQLAPIPTAVNIPLAVLSDSENWPIFVHCTHGQDRTGLVVAEFRVKVDGWDVERAEEEMLAYGFHRELIGLWLEWERFKYERTHRQG